MRVIQLRSEPWHRAIIATLGCAGDHDFEDVGRISGDDCAVTGERRKHARDEYAPRRKLTREFKPEAVRQAAMSEKPKAQLARELGVRVGQLRTWRLEFEKEAVTGIAKPDRSAAEDLEQLRRENARLKMEIEILKKAAIYFARESK